MYYSEKGVRVVSLAFVPRESGNWHLNLRWSNFANASISSRNSVSRGVVLELWAW